MLIFIPLVVVYLENLPFYCNIIENVWRALNIKQNTYSYRDANTNILWGVFNYNDNENCYLADVNRTKPTNIKSFLTENIYHIARKINLQNLITHCDSQRAL